VRHEPLGAAARRGPTKLPPWAANPEWAELLPLRWADRSAGVHARKDFRAVFFLRKLFRNSVSFNVPEARGSGTRGVKQAQKGPPPHLRRRKRLILPHGKSRKTHCLQFAARLAGTS
jgi:hypothetical protein